MSRVILNPNAAGRRIGDELILYDKMRANVEAVEDTDEKFFNPTPHNREKSLGKPSCGRHDLTRFYRQRLFNVA